MYYLPLLCALVAASVRAFPDLVPGTGISSGLSGLGTGIKNEIRDVARPVSSAVATIGSSQCSNVKKIVGMAYEQIEGEREPDVSKLTLKFISKNVSVTYDITKAAEEIPRSPGFDAHKKLFIYIHGFIDDPEFATFPAINSALFSQGEYNVLALDASPLIRWLYLRASTYVRFIGEKLGEVLAAMVKNGVNPSDIHIIGHSLGAHISGFAGKKFTNLTGMHVGRISGLDPAGPCFTDVDDDLKLKSTDADFVDVMHTNGGVYGLKEPLGHVDHFPNNGLQQPGCATQACSHLLAPYYYSESIVNPDAFPAVRCKDWDAFKKGQCENEISYMGYPSKPGTRGLYFLQTSGKAPYGLGMKGTKFTNNDGILKTILG